MVVNNLSNIKTYFNLQPTINEIFFISYIHKRMIELAGKEINEDTKIQKIRVKVIHKLHLPVLTFWYLYGATSLAEPKQEISWSADEIWGYGISHQLINGLKREDLDSNIVDAIKSYNRISSQSARRKQYQELDNSLYICIYKIEQTIKRDLSTLITQVIKLLQELDIEIPIDHDYSICKEVLFEIIIFLKRLDINKEDITKWPIKKLLTDFLLSLKE